MKYFILFTLSFYINNSFSSELDKIKWVRIEIPYNFILSKDIKENSLCNFKTYDLLNMVKNKNPKKDLNNLRSGDLLFLPRCKNFNKKLYIGENQKSKIKNTKIKRKWEKISIKKGQILSNILKENGCNRIFDIEIPLFKERNSLENVNELEIYDSLNIQKCKYIKEKPIVVVGEQKKEIANEKDYYWFLYLNSYRKNNDSWKMYGGIDLDLNLIELIRYEMNLIGLDNMYLFNHVGLELASNKKESINLGVGFVNNTESQTYNFYFLQYRREFGKHYSLKFKIGTNFERSNNYLRTDIFYKNIGLFYNYFEDHNILDENQRVRYNIFGFGVKF